METRRALEEVVCSYPLLHAARAVGFISLVRKERRLRLQLEALQTQQVQSQIDLNVVNAGGYIDPTLPALTPEEQDCVRFLQRSKRIQEIIRQSRMKNAYVRNVLRRRADSLASSRSNEVLSGASPPPQT